MLVDGDGERGRGVPEHGGNDHGVHTTAAQLGGDGVAHVVQARVGMHARLTRQAFERAGEGVGIDQEPVTAVAHERDGTSELVEGIVPSRSERGAPLQLFAAVPPDPLQGEGGKLNDPA